jgi:hypothetical protein
MLTTKFSTNKKLGLAFIFLIFHVLAVRVDSHQRYLKSKKVRSDSDRIDSPHKREKKSDSDSNDSVGETASPIDSPTKRPTNSPTVGVTTSAPTGPPENDISNNDNDSEDEKPTYVPTVYTSTYAPTSPPKNDISNSDSDSEEEDSSNDFIIVGDNDVSSNDNDSEDFEDRPFLSLNLVLVPQCDPDNSDSFYSQSKRDENGGRTDYLEDTMADCGQYLGYCDKKRSNLENSWPNYVSANDFYNAMEMLYDQCFKTCAESLPGGVEEFCSIPKAREIDVSAAAEEYCESVDDSDWTAHMIAHEAAVLAALNVQRDDSSGHVCTEKDDDESMIQEFFPRSSPVVTSDSIRCAARIQAKNIVKATIEQNRFPSSLHRACPDEDFGGGEPICERFSTRMVNAGYTYSEEGFGRINEVTAVGYRSAEDVIEGWLSSQSGHCSAILKQESLVIPTEVGIGYYRDEASGMTGHVMLLGQRQL